MTSPLTITPDRPEPSDTVRALWRRWTDVIVAIQTRKSTRVSIRPAEFVLLQSTLSDALNEWRNSAPSQQSLCTQLRELIGPWVTLESVVNMHPAVLADFAAKCDAMDHTLNGRRIRWRRLKRGMGTATLAALALFAALALATGSLQGCSQLVDEQLRRTWLRVNLANETWNMWTLAALFTVGVVFAGALTLRSTRKY